MKHREAKKEHGWATNCIRGDCFQVYVNLYKKCSLECLEIIRL